MGKKGFRLLGLGLGALLCGWIALGGAGLGPALGAEPDPARALENRFIEVAKRVGPAIVSISTEAVEKVPLRRYRFEGSPFPEFDEDLFDRFFRDFFGEMPGREFKQRGLGTGVIIDEEGYILTNEHVVHGADKVTVTLPDGREFGGKIQGTDPRSDLAVIKIDARQLPVARLGDSDQVRIGQWAIAVGNPFGWAVGNAEPTLTVGVISALHRSIRIGGAERDYSDLIQTDAAINPGNSGGPLVNLAGEVIGINVAIFSTSGGYQGIGFAIPVNVAKAIVGDLMGGKKILYGWLGIHIQDMTDELMEHFKLPSREGVIVVRVMADSPAQAGGLQDGDVIVGFGGEPVKEVRELLKKVGRAKVGAKVPVEVIRDGKRARFSVEIGERPSEAAALGPGSGQAWRGMKVSPVTPELAARFRLDAEEGLVITELEPGSPADDADLQVGDLILEINRTPVRTASEFGRQTAASRGKTLVKTSRGFFVLREESP